MTARGGFLAIYPAILLSGDGFPDLSLAAVGAWLRIRATSEITGEPVSSRTTERLGVTVDVLAELNAASMLEATDDHYLAIGMPDAPRRPSDTPGAWSERQAARRAGLTVDEYRARQTGEVTTLSDSPVRSTPLHSTPVSRGHALSRVTGRDTSDLAGKYEAMVESGDGPCHVCGKPIERTDTEVMTPTGPMHQRCQGSKPQPIGESLPDAVDWISKATP
jgi:hypothetical protein